MSVKNKYPELVEKRNAIESDIDYDNNPVIKEMIALLTEDINETIDFIINDCTQNQFICMSEIFDELAEKTKSSELINALRTTALKYPDATLKYNINYFIDSAEEYI